MKLHYLILGFIVLLAFGGCSGNGAEGGTETGTTNAGLDTSTIGGKIESTADTLVLSVVSSGESSLSVPNNLRAAVDGTSDEWDSYLDPSNITALTDVFGSPDDDPAPVTRIRVLIDDFRDTVEGIFAEDPEITCEGASALNGGDTVEIAFYDPVSNGTAEDRYFDCVSESTGEDAEDIYVTLYGIDADNVVRIVSMMNTTGDNIWYPEERGNFLQNLQVVNAAYAESEGEGETIGYLDIQYAQASIYSGLDDDIEAGDDNVLFKSRTRITGRAVLDEAGDPLSGNGDFTVTKYDRGINDDDTVWEIVTQSTGRGSYGAGDYSLFKVDSTASSLVGQGGTFCVQMPEEGTDVPAYADSANCTALETSFAWESAVFPFTLSPDVEEAFDDNLLFEGDDTDLIGNSGDNFSIPTYD